MKNRESRQLGLGDAPMSKDWLMDATRRAQITSKPRPKKERGSGGIGPATKTQRTLDAYLSAWKWPK